MNDETEAKLTIINRLLASFPATQSGSSDDVIDGYLLGTASLPAAFLAVAAQRFLEGSVAGQHMVYPPSPAQLATEARVHWHRALDAGREVRRGLQPPDKQDIPEDERERVKAGFNKLIEDLSAKIVTDDAGDARRRKAIFDRTNARFYPDMSPAVVRKRLGFSVGDPDGDEAAA